MSFMLLPLFLAYILMLKGAACNQRFISVFESVNSCRKEQGAIPRTHSSLPLFCYPHTFLRCPQLGIAS